MTLRQSAALHAAQAGYRRDGSGRWSCCRSSLYLLYIKGVRFPCRGRPWGARPEGRGFQPRAGSLIKLAGHSSRQPSRRPGSSWWGWWCSSLHWFRFSGVRFPLRGWRRSDGSSRRRGSRYRGLGGESSLDFRSSSRRTSLTSPVRTPPWMAAPIATTSSGLTPLLGTLPKNSSTFFWTAGIRVEPPTKITSLMSLLLKPASFIA